MGTGRWFLAAAAAVAAVAAAAGAALGVGPWPGLAGTVAAPTGDVGYTAVRSGASTTVKKVTHGKVLASASVAGTWGIPAVTSNGLAGGLSPDGRLLVLVEPPRYQGLRERSRFRLVSTPALASRGTIVLRGEFGFDAISPDGRTLYVIQHASRDDLVSYVVRAYDLRARRLLPGAIVDKREADETMRGYPVARATSARGTWVYTLYTRPTGKPFVHALNAAARSAFCIDLPWSGSTDDVWEAGLALTPDGQELRVRSGSGETVATVDTRTLRVR